MEIELIQRSALLISGAACRKFFGKTARSRDGAELRCFLRTEEVFEKILGGGPNSTCCTLPLVIGILAELFVQGLLIVESLSCGEISARDQVMAFDLMS